MMLKFVNDLKNKFNSLISDSFLGLMKITNVCNECKIITFSFNSFFFVTFNLEFLLKNNRMSESELNLAEQFINQKKFPTKNRLYCSKCLNKTLHRCNKEYYQLPNLLIISIQRGITYNYKTPINIPQTLDLTNSVELQFSKNRFNLVSLLGRTIKNGNETFFSIVSVGNNWFYCEGTIIKEISFPLNYNSFGDIIMLFYM